MDQAKFGRLLAELREERDLTQDQVGDIFGVTGKTVSKWECGNAVPDFNTLINISKEFQVSLYELSIGERFHKGKLSKKDLLKVFDKQTLLKLSMKQKIKYFVISIFLIFSLICIVYTIINYNRNKVYVLESTNSEYYIDGIFTKSRNYKVLTVSKVEYLGAQYSRVYENIHSYYYEVLNNNKRIYHSNVYCDEDEEQFNFYDMINSISFFLDDNSEDLLYVNSIYNLTFNIYYTTFEKKDNVISFDIKFNNKD